MDGGWEQAVSGFVGGDGGRSVLLRGCIDGQAIEAGAGADVSRPGASVLKLVTAVAVHEAYRAGTVHPDEEVAVADLPISRWPSVLNLLDTGRKVTVAELVAFSLATSDNRSAHHLVGLIGVEAVNQVAVDLGCLATEMRVGFADELLHARARTNRTTARDCAAVLEAIAEREDLAPVLRSLDNNLAGTRIPLRLPAEVVTAHKTGTLEGVVNDVGLVKAERGAFVACFLTEGQSDLISTNGDIGTCARDAYDAWQQGRP